MIENCEFSANKSRSDLSSDHSQKHFSSENEGDLPIFLFALNKEDF